nr:PBP1A family penicillin-binding protein [Rubricella aquisinus]
MDEFVRERRVFTPADEIPDIVKQAFISAEDKNFYEHWGFDPRGIASAVLDAARGGRLRGASTITQQVVKNFLLSGEREIERKIREIILAVQLESVLEKEQILELYLNEIFLGENSYGITAAARNYFAKSLSELTPAEAAFLAALPKAPSNRHPVDDRDVALFWRNNTLREMGENGYLPKEDVAFWQEQPLDTIQGGEIEAPEDIRLPGRSYFTDEVRRQLVREIGEEKLFTGGLTIRATIDPVLQQAAQDALRTGLLTYAEGREGYRGPIAQIPEDMTLREEDWRAALRDLRIPRDIEDWRPAVVTLVGNFSVRVGIEGVEEDEDGHFVRLADTRWARPQAADGTLGAAPSEPSDVWSLGDVIYVTEGEVDGEPRWLMKQVPEIQGAFMAMDTRTGRVLALQGGFDYGLSAFNRATQARRQPGSSFKPFVYAAALDQGFTPSTIVLDAPFVLDQGPNEDPWIPKNYSGEGNFYGPQLMRVGIERSLNLMTVRIADDVGMETVAEYAEGFGIYDEMPSLLSYSLGAGDTTLFRMLAAYAQFANGGQKVTPSLVDRVQDRRGNTIIRHDARLCQGCDEDYAEGDAPWVLDPAERVMSDLTAYRLISMLEGVVDRGTASGSLGDLDYPLAGKTGTTNEARDAWFIGFSPSIVAGCFIGYDSPRPMGRGGTGGGLCAPVFRDFMDVVIENEVVPPGQFKQPPNTVLVKIDRNTGIRLPDETTRDQADYVQEVYPLDAVPAVYADVSRTIGGGGNFTLGDLAVTTDPQEVAGDTGEDGVRPPPPPPPAGSLDSGGLY